MRFAALLSVLALTVAATAAVQAQPARTADAVAHLRQHASALGLEAADTEDLAVTDAYVSRRSGVSHVYLRQRLDGLDVIGSEVTVNLDRDGRALHTAGRPVAALARRATLRRALLDANAAVRRAADLAGLALPDGMVVARREAGPARATTFAETSLTAEPVEARLVYHPDARGDLRQAWEVGLYTRDRQHYWLSYVDAGTGAELARHDLVVHDSFGHDSFGHDSFGHDSFGHGGTESHGAQADHAEGPGAPAQAGSYQAGSYQVYAYPTESPSHGGRSLAVNPADAVASPFGWHDTDGAPGAEFTVTRGNNVHAYRDADADGTPEAGESPDGGRGLAFGFPADLAQPPAAYADAAVTNLFYWTNLVHDVLYRYGFDEAAGNFQLNNYGRGGAGGDAVRAEAQDGGGSNNANFFTPADGSRPRMQMYLWNHTAPGRDGDLDNGLIVHEYAHGLSNRLTGGPGTVSCLTNQEQMGEGWSDYYALMLTLKPGSTGADRRGIGTYAKGQPTTGPGLRPTPYSTSFAVNGATYGDLASQAIPHGVGYVWATILWEATWELIERYGFSPEVHDAGGTAGNQVMLSLVTEALKLQPCSPGFVDGRDAILAADTALYGGAYSADLWRAFARRGLGLDADQGSSLATGDETEDFAEPGPPPAAALSPASVSAHAPSGGRATATLTLSNTAAAGSRSLNFTAAPMASAAPARPADRRGAPVGPPVAFSGSDAFGYTWTESGQPGGPAVAFRDVSGSGSALTFAPASGSPGGDEGYADVALPFAFPFYGTDRASVRVLSNGVLTFSAFAGNSFDNRELPDADAPNALIAPLWDDLDQSSGGAVYAGALPDGRFVVQWDDVPRYNQPASALTFQVLLSPDGAIEFQYGSLAGGLSADAGIEDDAGAVGLSTVDAVASHSAVRITAPLAWASVAPASGSVAAGSAAELVLSLDGSGLADGVYAADLVVGTNDPARPVLRVPVTFTVGDAGGTAAVAAVRTSGPTVPAGGGVVTYDVTFTNASGADFEGVYWIAATLPNGRPFGPPVFGPAALSLAGGASVTESLTGTVPPRAPAGTYTVTAYVGAAFPDAPDGSSRFTFEKLGGRLAFSKTAPAPTASAWTTKNLTRGTTASAPLDPAEAQAGAALVVGAYPSPFRERTTVRFALAEAGPAQIAVYDVVGRRVALLAEGPMAAGPHEVTWEADALPSGVYVVRLGAGAQVQTQRVTLLR